MTEAQPTSQDYEAASLRAEIAQRFRDEYEQCRAWAEAAFGPGWLPSHRHTLIDKDEEARYRYSTESPVPAKTVYTVRHEATGEARHFTVEDGRVIEHAGMEAGFGSMLLEPHPTRGFEHQGKWVPYHRYSLYWS